MRKSVKLSLLLATGVLLVQGTAAPVAHAQSAQSHDDMPGMHRSSKISMKAAVQIASVMRAVSALGNTDSAARKGFSPVLGWIPTMGEHWVNRPAMRSSKQDLLSPDNLMFSRINGRDSLVGVAYAYYAAESDTTRPALFNGSPAWHEHANIAPDGQTVVMLHVWFVPSPDGPFAGTNPNLPYWALGLAAPNAARISDTTYASRARRAALALAEVADTTAMFPTLERRPTVHAAISMRRDSVRALIPQLKSAQAAGEESRIDAVTEQLATQWDAMHAVFVGSALTADGRRRIESYVAMLMSDHSH